MLIQRLGSKTQKDDKFLARLINIIKQNPKGCDEVWLASDYGFPPLSAHKASAQKLLEIADMFRRENIRVSLQISNTIGHGEYMSVRDCSGLVYENSPVGHMVGPDGTSAEYCFCPNDNFFRNYTVSTIKEYAKIMPDCVWIDDDLRAVNHAPVQLGCYCDNCIKKFNNKHGSNHTRESLVYAINNNLEWRKKYIDFIRETLYDFTYLISKAVNEVSKESRMGLQHCYFGGYTGYGTDFIFDAMKAASGKNPCSRPGGGAYCDTNPNDFIEKSRLINRQNNILPEYVDEICPEIENLPDVMFGKTIAGTVFETMLYFANGATSMSYAMLMNDYEPMSWHGKMLSEFCKYRDYWEKLSEFNKYTHQAGVKSFFSKNAWKLTDGNDFSWAYDYRQTGGAELSDMAIPFAYCNSSEKQNEVYILTFESASLMDKYEIESLLDKNVLTDGETLKYLNELGYCFGADAQHIQNLRFHEIFSNHRINEGIENQEWGQTFYYKAGWYIIDNDGTTETFGTYFSPSDSQHFKNLCANAVVYSPKGAKWAVFGHYVWHGVVSSAKRRQILNAIDYISGGRMNAVVETPVKALVFARENDDDRLCCVSVLNRTVGAAENLIIKIKNPAGNNFTLMSLSSPAKKCEYTVSGNEYFVKIPKIAPWSISTIFID